VEVSARLNAPWLTAGPLPRLLELLDREGEEAAVIGGAVRNALIDVPVHEFDVATTAVPEEVVRRVTAAGFKAVPTGIEHGTVTVVIDGQPFEVTTLREDVETYGRKAKVAFGRDWTRDAQRRDFTINALSATRDGSIRDYTGGLADLRARRVRFIGEASQRIAEDYLRILRFFRFHAAYGEGALDPGALRACIAARAGLDTLSRERVRMEMLKLLAARHAVPAIVAMAEGGLIIPVLGGVPYLAAFSNMIKAEASTGEAPDPVRRLGALAVFVAEDAERLGEKLRLSNDERARLSAMGEGWWRVDPARPEKERRALLYRLGPQHYSDRALLAFARSRASATDRAWNDLVALPRRWSVPKFPLTSADFVSRGIEKGPKLGAALRAAEEAWIEADFPADPAALKAIADRSI
jgi:poly(A) polymerase